MKIVLAAGVFDILHPGHLYFLRQAKTLGDKLVVVITSDQTAAKQRKKPLFAQTEREALISSLAFVDEVVIGFQGESLKSVVDVNPDVVALGYDQWHNITQLKNQLKRLGWSGKVVRIDQYKNYSSSHYGRLRKRN